MNPSNSCDNEQYSMNIKEVDHETNNQKITSKARLSLKDIKQMSHVADILPSKQTTSSIRSNAHTLPGVDGCSQSRPDNAANDDRVRKVVNSWRSKKTGIRKKEEMCSNDKSNNGIIKTRLPSKKCINDIRVLQRAVCSGKFNSIPHNIMIPMSARPGTRGGAGFGNGALNSMVQVSDRPVTRQGLGGMKTQSQGPTRMVQDKSYWLGLLRGKISELNNEVAKLSKEIGQFNQENASYVSYEKKAEMLAGEVKDLQGELADYNTIVDKLNTNSSFDDLEEDKKMVKQQNERDSTTLEKLFAQNQEKDKQLKKLEKEMDRERMMTESVVADMDPELRGKFSELKSRNLTLQEELEYKQQQLDTLNEKIDNMEEEISQSNVKQEAVSLHERIMELEEKRNSLVDEVKTKETPAEERERLLKQVKDDNQEIARMENRTKEITEKTEKIQDDIGQLDMDLEEHHGERTAKYKELKKRDEDMQEFLDSFENNKQAAEEKQKALEENIVQLLEKISRADVQSKHMPSTNEFQQMQDDLNFKENEMAKSRDTATGLDGEHARLNNDLEKVEQLENKISTELNNLKQRIINMNEELVKYSDLDALKRSANDKKKLLEQEKTKFKNDQTKMKEDVQELSNKYEQMKSTLEDNETYAQLGNLERKWQHLEQNNFAMKEFINSKSSESNYAPIKDSVSGWVDEINQQLIQMNASTTR